MKKRTDIPYAQRLIQKKADEIIAQRNEAATLALGVMMCTLSEEYGFGYQRLCHLARETMENIHDVYGAGSKEDVELACEHVRQRLRQIGFTVSPEGRIYGHIDETGKPVHPRNIQTTEEGGRTYG